MNGATKGIHILFIHHFYLIKKITDKTGERIIRKKERMGGLGGMGVKINFAEQSRTKFIF